MNKVICSALLALGFFVLSAEVVRGQKAQPTSADRLAIANIWNEIAAAVGKKDRTALEKIYSPDFVHIHAKGKIDDRKERLDTILLGGPNIDVGGEVEFGFRRFGDTMVAAGTVKTTGDDGKPVTYAVTKVYTRESGRWLYVSSQASAVIKQ